MKKIVYSLIILFFLTGLFLFWDDISSGYQRFLFEINSREGITDSVIEKIKRRVSSPAPLRSSEDHPASFLDSQLIIQLVNQEREDNGLAPLSENHLLNQSAGLKVDDMFARQYFSHDAPSGEKVSDLIDQTGYQFILAGENLALGNFKDSQALVSAWMDSPGHRANILNPGYRAIGIAVKQSDFDNNLTWLAVQHFATPASLCPEPDPLLAEEIELKKERLEEIEDTLETLEEKIINMQPKRGAVYRDAVETYNDYVALYNELVTEIEALIKQYDQTINLFNQCIADFKNN